MIKFNIQFFAANDAVAPVSPVTAAGGMIKTTDLTLGMQQYYNKDLLENARPDLYFSQFSKKTALPGGSSKTAQFRGWNTLATATTALTEGVTPAAGSLSQREVTGTIKQYGNYVVVTDLLDLTHIDDTVLGASEELGAQAGQTLDELTRNALMTGTNVSYAPSVSGGTVTPVTSRASLTTNCKLTGDVVAKAVTKLKKKNVPKIDGKYFAIIHPCVAEDLRLSDGWIDAHKYANPTEIYTGEIGELHGVRFVETTQAPIFSNGASSGAITVFGCFFFGKDAFGEIDLEGGGLEMIVKPLGSGGSSDPLNQRQTIGWKASHCAVILNAERLLRVECGSSYTTEPATYTAVSGEYVADPT